MALFIPPTAMCWALNSGETKQWYSNDSVADGYVFAYDTTRPATKDVNGMQLEAAKNLQINNLAISNLCNDSNLGIQVCDDTTNHLRVYTDDNIGSICVSYA